MTHWLIMTQQNLISIKELLLWDNVLGSVYFNYELNI